ncbi:glycerophosphodiester phosphodiesterase family protein [Martelella sp. HB161492]|uniref:glycerophosphodiester phosphodiesterase family protein n=1 Tax=Martelella sp. HB161492 TaxID=2720726 RepID=UPI0015909E0E|nr:glycerophosphodiester phosphodiesterase family protein [Martelella sp. HB161492]
MTAIDQLWPARRFAGRPSVIAHRGASAHATENTLHAYAAAADLGADMWEIDVHLTADGVPVISHDASTEAVFGIAHVIADTDFQTLRRDVPGVPTLRDVVDLARQRDQALYIEIKGKGSGVVALAALEKWGFDAAVFGSFNHDEVRAMAAVGSRYQISVLVRKGEDPFEAQRDTGAGIIHLCWEKASERPQDLVTPELIARAAGEGIGIVLWHEERPAVLEDLVTLPVLGICSNQPELIGGFSALPSRRTVVVCHRGVNHLAPENTKAAAVLAYDLGADILELDVRETADGVIVVLHDKTLDRTTDATGFVVETALSALEGVDAGRWFSPFYAGESVLTLQAAIALCKARGRQMYIENKAVRPEKLVALVRQMDFLDQCFFWSADMALMDGMRAVSPDVRLKSNIAHHGSIDAMIDRLQPVIAEIMLEDWEEEAPLCRARGITPMLHYFGDDPAVFARIAKLAPEMINLNRADMLLDCLKRLS